MDRLNRITIVLAYWCPHCSPLSIEYISRVSEELKTECRILDIDNQEQEIIADEIVKKFSAKKFDTLEDVLKDSDYVTLHCPGGGDNINLMNKERLALMKKLAPLVA